MLNVQPGKHAVSGGRAGAPDVQFLCSRRADLAKNYTADKFSYTPAQGPDAGARAQKKPRPGGAWIVGEGRRALRAGFEAFLQGIGMDHVLPDHAVAAPALAGKIGRAHV